MILTVNAKLLHHSAASVNNMTEASKSLNQDTSLLTITIKST